VSYIDLFVTLAIVAAVAFSAWRVGQVNPVGTGRLARRLNTLELKVAEQGARMDAIEQSILTIAESVSGVGERLSQVDTRLGAISIDIAADRGVTERTWSAVSRLEGFFIQDSFEARREGRR
jgi:uncharacterized coiled-coil protein SlyX